MCLLSVLFKATPPIAVSTQHKPISFSSYSRILLFPRLAAAFGDGPHANAVTFPVDENPFSDQTPDFFVQIVKAPSFETDARCRPDPLNANEMIPFRFVSISIGTSVSLNESIEENAFIISLFDFGTRNVFLLLIDRITEDKPLMFPEDIAVLFFAFTSQIRMVDPLELAVANNDPSGDHASLSRTRTPITSDTAESNSVSVSSFGNLSIFHVVTSLALLLLLLLDAKDERTFENNLTPPLSFVVTAISFG